MLTKSGSTAKAARKSPRHMGRSAVSGQLVMKPVVKIPAARAAKIRAAVRKVLAEQQG